MGPSGPSGLPNFNYYVTNSNIARAELFLSQSSKHRHYRERFLERELRRKENGEIKLKKVEINN